MDANQFGVRAGCPVDKPRSPAADLAGGDARKARKRGVSFSLGYFSFGQAKEKYLALRRRVKALLFTTTRVRRRLQSRPRDTIVISDRKPEFANHVPHAP
jgi:hypothetical protein